MNRDAFHSNRKPDLRPYVVHFTIVNAFFWVIRLKNWWHFFGVTAMKPEFADLRAYTAPVSCAQNGVNFIEENCDPWDRNIGGLRTWVPIFRFFNLNESRTFAMGLAMQILLLASIYCITYLFRINLSAQRNFSLMLLLLLSPPLALVIERGQTESLFFVSIAFVGFLLNRNQKYFAFLILGALAILKYYPILILILSVINQEAKNSKKQVIFGCFFLTLSATYISYMLDSGELLAIKNSTINAGFSHIFGITATVNFVTMVINKIRVFPVLMSLTGTETQLIGLVAFCSITLIFMLLQSRGVIRKMNLSFLDTGGHDQSEILTVSFFMVYISYFIVTSYDYRMIYLIPFFILGLERSGKKSEDHTQLDFSYGILLLMWAQINLTTSIIGQFIFLFLFAFILASSWEMISRRYLGIRKF
jgi:hypothetical protein